MKHFTLLLVALTTMCSTAFAQQKPLRSIYAHSSVLNVQQLQSENPTQLNRILFAGYNTLCLPMTLTAEQLQQAAPDVQVERLAAIRQEGNTVNLYFLDCTAEGIEAGVPYLIYTPKTQYLRARNTEAVAIGTQLMPVTLSDEQGNRVTFASSWSQLNGDGRFGIPAKQDTEILQSVLVRTQPDQRFLPTRCGFIWEQQSSTATELMIKHVASLDAIQTGVQTLKAKNALVDVYDTKGTLIRRQVSISAATSNLPAGIYVVGGEKVLVR
jgi:hypothetical protein